MCRSTLTIPRSGSAFILEDLNATLVVTDDQTIDRLPHETKHLVLDAKGDTPSRSPAPATTTYHPASLPDRAYIIYTSGSTGHPKGVVISHVALAHYIQWAAAKYVQSRTLSFPLFSPLSFDLTVTSLFLPLVTGGTLVVYPESGKQADLALLDVLQDNQVDIIKLTPSHLALLAGRDLSNSRVRQLILGGEDLRSSMAKDIFTAFNGAVEIHNEYGPTEATVGCIVHTFDPEKDQASSVPIGQVISGMQAYILNDHLQPVPQGVMGELYLSGRGLADGYWNRSDLNDARFPPHPLIEGQCMYRTGDLARLRDDGVMEYHGRIDQQVKWHGVRIELGELETAFLHHPQVTGCVVDFARSSIQPQLDDIQHCTRCGLPSNYPDATFDPAGVCHLCTSFDAYRAKSEVYFRSLDDLRCPLC